MRVEREGDRIRLTPLTDADTVADAGREWTDSFRVHYAQRERAYDLAQQAIDDATTETLSLAAARRLVVHLESAIVRIEATHLMNKSEETK